MAKREKIGLEQVREALLRLAAAEPKRVDRRAAARKLVPRYTEQGAPACLAAFALHDLGISVGVLKALDNELPGTDVVRLDGTRHPIRRKFTEEAWQALQYAQRGNDRGYSWYAVAIETFRWDESDLYVYPHLRTRPWVTRENGIRIGCPEWQYDWRTERGEKVDVSELRLD